MMRSVAGALLILILLCTRQSVATTSSVVTNTLVEYFNVIGPPWITTLYTINGRSKIACAALGLQTTFCQTVQYNQQNRGCMLILDRIPMNMNFISTPNFFTINLNRNPCIGTQMITFDDIPNSSPTDAAIPSSYACFTWINGWYANATTTATVGTGYQTILTSGQYVALNRNGTKLTMSLTNGSFNIISLWVSAAYMNTLSITMSGLRNNITIYNTTVTVDMNIRSFIQLNWTTINTATFMSNPSGQNYQFAMDNIVVTFL